MSVIIIRITIPILVCLCKLNCFSNTVEREGRAKTIDFEVVVSSPEFFKNEHLITTTLKNKEEEQTFLTQTPRQPYWNNSGGPFYLELPETVDYQNNMVIGILLGFRTTMSTGIRVDSIKQIAGELRVYSTEILPCIREDAIGYPFVLVKLKRYDLPVVFDTIRYIEEPCQE